MQSFEWDEAKNLANQKKHGLSFRQATAVFDDPLHFAQVDRFEGGEERWKAIGVVAGTYVSIAYTVLEVYRDGLFIEIVRIISARPASKRERREYENENG